MNVGVIGSGNIGANAGRLFSRAGHNVLFSYSRDESKLKRLAEETGNGARWGSPHDAVEFADVLVLAVTWDRVEDALDQAGSLDGKVLVDTTNPYPYQGSLVEVPGGHSSGAYNARRAEGASLIKAFNTSSAGFQRTAAFREGDERATMFLAGDDEEAKQVVSSLIRDVGFEPVDVGDLENGAPWIEPPRRSGGLYGEEYRAADGRRIAEAIWSDPEEATRLADELKVFE